MPNCPTCDTDLSSDHFAIIGQKIEDTVDWSSFGSDDKRWGYPEGKTFTITGIGELKVVKKSVEYEGYRDSYGDGLTQGTEFGVYVILEHAGRYFRKEGTGNSYESIDWNGPFKEVFPRETTVTVYEFN